MKPIRINIDDFPSIVVTLLRRHKSSALKIVNYLRKCIAGKSNGICHTDRWPDFTTVVLRLKNTVRPNEFSLISSDPQEAQRLLINYPGLIINEENYIQFADIQKLFIGTIKDIIESRGYTVSYEEEHLLLEAKTDDDLPAVPPLPVGYRPRKLSVHDAELITSFWFQAPGADQYIKHVLEHHQNVGVETDSGELVGWILEHGYGAHGALHTLEAHRRKGLGKYLTMSHRDLFLAMDKPSFMLVSPENTASLKLAESCGFKVVNDGEVHEHIFLSFQKKVQEGYV